MTDVSRFPRAIDTDKLSEQFARLAYPSVAYALITQNPCPEVAEIQQKAQDVGHQVAMGWLLFLKHYLRRCDGGMDLSSVLLPTLKVGESTELWNGLRGRIASLPISFGDTDEMRRGFAGWLMVEGGTFLFPYGVVINIQPSQMQKFTARRA